MNQQPTQLENPDSRRAAPGTRVGSIEATRPYDRELAKLTDRFSEHASVIAGAVVLKTNEKHEIDSLSSWQTDHIVNLRRLNSVRYVNKFLEAVNEQLSKGSYFIGCAETASQRRDRILSKFPGSFGLPVYAFDFLLKRVCPKVAITKRPYFYLTKGRNRVFSKTEILGRVVACGFEIVEVCDIDSKLYFVARKAGPPAYDLEPSYGPIFKMKRVGQGGRPIHVYKMRTMHPYSEYLQAYVYETNSLDANGKIKDDYRIAPWGKLMRRCFLDEVPMLINLFAGQMKLVGVRPISEHYLSLYPPEVHEERIKQKPGLIPPYYVDLPEGFEEVLESELKYMKAYEKRPIRTDVQYFFTAMYNIFVRRARSQ